MHPILERLLNDNRSISNKPGSPSPYLHMVDLTDGRGRNFAAGEKLAKILFGDRYRPGSGVILYNMHDGTWSVRIDTNGKGKHLEKHALTDAEVVPFFSALSTTMPVFDYNELDHGIRNVVKFLHAQGFDTCDSGDGVSKADWIASGDALPYPHVDMQVLASKAFVEAHRLRFTLEARHITVEPIGPDPNAQVSIQVTYDPAAHPLDPVDDKATITLMGLNDEKLLFHLDE